MKTLPSSRWPISASSAICSRSSPSSRAPSWQRKPKCRIRQNFGIYDAELPPASPRAIAFSVASVQNSYRKAYWQPFRSKWRSLHLKDRMSSTMPLISIDPPATLFAGEQRTASKPHGRLRDSHGRAITDLRISVTDRCNYKCVYCRTGEEGVQFTELPIADYLRMIRAFVSLGIEKVRLTGGEPLLRSGLVEMVQEIARMRTAYADDGTELAPGDPDARPLD